MIAENGLSAPVMDQNLNQSDSGIFPVTPSSLTPRSSAERLNRLRQLIIDYDLDGYLIVDSGAHYTFNGQNYQDRRISFITSTEV
jgi:hypothetical protein